MDYIQARHVVKCLINVAMPLNRGFCNFCLVLAFFEIKVTEVRNLSMNVVK